MKILIELSEYDGLQTDLFAAQQALITEGTRADQFAAALKKVAELGGHEYMDCSDIATNALACFASQRQGGENV